MGNQELLDQAEQVSVQFRMNDLVKEGLRNWLEEALTLCAIITAVATMVAFGFS